MLETIFKVKKNNAHYIQMPKGSKGTSEDSALITPIPPITDPHVSEIEIAPVESPYSYIRIEYDNVSNEYIYHVIEPPLTMEIEDYVSVIEEEITKRLQYVVITDMQSKVDYMMDLARDVMKTMVIHLSPIEKKRLEYYLRRDFLGYGIIQVPMIDVQVEDISCDGVGIPIYIYHRKYGSIRSTLKFTNEKELDYFVVWLAQRCGKHISVSNPMLDATIPDGSRLQATLGKYVTKKGSSFTIRRFREDPFTPLNLIKFKTASEDMMAYLWLAIESGQSMMVCGGTASGKTTTLNAVLLFIPPQMKIVSIEDTRELNLPHENWIPLLTRSGFGAKNPITGKAAGEVDMFDLLTTSLRQRPQYLMVGEVRGAEAFIVFQAMATGKTSYTTFHAESVSAMVHRMENPPISLPRALISSLNIVSLQGQVKVGNKLTRRIKGLTEIVGIDPETNELITNTTYSWNPADDTFTFGGHSYVYEKIANSKAWSMKEMEKEVKRRIDVLRYLQHEEAKAASTKTPFTFRNVAKIVAWYYKEPLKVAEMARASLEEDKKN
ncbi:MAG: type II/IV secretion system ATPase subunit [Thermoplasmata archaeon]